MWLVTRPIRFPLRRANFSAARTSRPVRTSALKSGRGRGRHLPTETSDIAFAFRMNAVGQDDDGGAAAGIDPQRSAGETSVAETLSGSEAIATIAGIRRLHIPAVGALAARHRMRRSHETHRRGRENAFALEGAAVEQHLSIDRQVVRGGKETRMSGDAAQGPGTRIVDFADQPTILDLFSRGGAVLESAAGPKGGVGQAQRKVDVLTGKDVQRLAADALDQFAQDEETDVAVGEAFSRRRDRTESVDAFEGLVGAVTVVVRELSAMRPLVWSRRCSTVMASLPLAANSGMNWATRSVKRSLPCSIRSMIEVAVAIGLVSEARSKTVSAVMGTGVGFWLRRP